MKMTFTATRLRIVLSVSLFLTFAFAVVGFYYIYTQLNDFAVQVSQTTGESMSGQTNLTALQTVSNELQTQQATISRAENIVAQSKSYVYQDQIIKDLNDFAKQSGVTITGINFIASPTSSSSSATGAAVPLVTSSAGGLKSTTLSLTLKNPSDYKNTLRFIQRIENNLTRMQVSGLSLTSDPTNGGVSLGALSLEVYVR